LFHKKIERITMLDKKIKTVGAMKAIGDKLRSCTDGCSLTNFNEIVDKIFGNHPNVAIVV